MKALNYWQEFVNTGKIEDYLSYVGQQDYPGEDMESQRNQSGADPYAGIHMCNRNDIEANACGRI